MSHLNMDAETRAATYSQRELVVQDVHSLAELVMADLNKARRDHQAIYSEMDMMRIAIAVAFSKINGSFPEFLRRMTVEQVNQRAPGVAEAFISYASELGELGIAKGTGGIN